MASSSDRYQRLVQRTAEVRERMAEAGELLKAARHEASSEDEKITATVDANSRLVGLSIDPRVLRRPDSEGLAEAIVDAAQRAANSADTAMGKLLETQLGVSVDPGQLRAGQLDDAAFEGIGSVLREDEKP